MGILNKIKGLFYEEEVVEVTEEKLQPNKIKQDFKEKENVIKEEKVNNEIKNNVSDFEFNKESQKFKFPVIFEDTDIKEEVPVATKIKTTTVEVKPTYNYNKPKLDKEVIKEVVEKPKKFSVSPVISPVFGILDKNYKKEEIKEKKDLLEQTKELVINFDTIRQKAFGTLEDELTNMLEEPITKKTTTKQTVLEKESVTSDDLLSDLVIEEETTTVKETTTEYDFSDFGVEYKIDDSSYKKPRHASKKENNKSESIEEAIDEVKNEEKENIELSEDLFNLIDSMYEK